MDAARVRRGMAAAGMLALVFAASGGWTALADDPPESPGPIMASDGTTLPQPDPSQFPTSTAGYAGSDPSAPTTASADSAAPVESYLSVAPSSIIPPDNRGPVNDTTVYPYRATVRITFSTLGGPAWCTGFLISARTVATAGHCVHSGGPGGYWFWNYTITPGQNGGSAPYGSCGAAVLWTVGGWVNRSKEKFDYGAIQLTCAVGNATGWYGMWWQADPLDGQDVKVTGYPSDKPFATMWQSNGTVRASTNTKVYYLNSTTPGESGSPAWRWSAAGPCTLACVMGIHAYGLHGAYPGNTFNSATRMNQNVFNNLVSLL